jgi:hypothetical protein
VFGIVLFQVVEVVDVALDGVPGEARLFIDDPGGAPCGGHQVDGIMLCAQPAGDVADQKGLAGVGIAFENQAAFGAVDELLHTRKRVFLIVGYCHSHREAGNALLFRNKLLHYAAS